VISHSPLPAPGAGNIQFDSAAVDDTKSSDNAPLLVKPSSNSVTYRRQAVLLLQGEWPWRLPRAWLQSLARLGRIFFHYERWTMRAWQTALITALSYDVVRYIRFPQERFGNDLLSIVFGLAPNPETVSRHWGSDRPPEAMFWLAPGVLMGLALSSMLRTACYRPLSLQGLTPDNTPLAFYRAKELQAVFYRLSSGNGLFDGYALSLLHNLGETSRLSRFPLNYRAIALMASFAGRERNSETEEDREEAAQEAVAHLTFHLDARRPWLRRLYTRYHLWRQGLDSNDQVRGLLPYALGVWVLGQFAFGLFARYHYWRLLGDKLAHVLDYHDRKVACEASGKQFFYAVSQDKDVCGLCPDWDFVRLADSDSLQACVDGLLRQPLSPEDLAARLTRLQGHAGLTSVDLSGYAWAYEWSPEAFAKVLEVLQAIFQASSDAALQRLDVSNGLRQTGMVSPLTLQALAAFVEQTRPQALSIRDYRLGQTHWPQVIPAFVNHTRQLDVSMSDFGDAGVWHMTAMLPGSALTGFIARDSGLSDGSAWALNATWLNGTLVSLDVADNTLTDNGFALLASMFRQRPGVRLDVSGIQLSAQGAHRFWPVVRHIEQLIVRDCGLREAMVVSLGPWLVNSTLQVLDMAHNPLDDGAVWTLAPDVLAAKVREWRLAYTLLSSLGLGYLGERLPLAGYLRVLDVSGCAMGESAAPFFVGALTSSLHALWLDEVELTSAGLAHLTMALRRHRYTTLRELSLDNNALSSEAVAAFIDAVTEGLCCDYLSLSGNGLNDTVLAPMGRLLAKEYLQHLSLNANQLTSLAAFVPHGRLLQVLDVADNALTGAGLMAWAQASVAPMPYFDRLRADTLTRAQRRDFSTLSATGALRLWNVSGHPLDAQDVHTLYRVAGQANYTVDVTASEGEAVLPFYQRSSAGRALPLGEVLSPWWRLLPAWRAAPLGVRSDTSFGLFQTPLSASMAPVEPRSAPLSGLGPSVWCLLFLSLLWLLRGCRVGRTKEAFPPEVDVSLRHSR
jgi:hypothetical protein